MRIAIGGASGFIGSALVPVLEAEAHDVVRLVRREARAPNEVGWDPASGRIDAERLAGVDAMISLSGANVGRRWTNARKREILDSRVDSTGLLARTAAALDPRPSTFLCAGGVGIYGGRGDEILTEESETGSGFLADVGRAWEASADPARAAGIRVVNFRQGVVLGRRGGALPRLLRPFKLGVGGRIGSGRQWWSWIGIDDLTSGYAFALRTDVHGVFNLMAPNPVTNAQLTRELGKALRRPTIFPAPALAISTLFGEMGQEMLLESQRALPARLLDAGFEFRYPELDSALHRALTG